MNDRSTINARRSERPGLSSTELQADGRQVWLHKVMDCPMMQSALRRMATVGR
jgi:hypothetical protein